MLFLDAGVSFFLLSTLLFVKKFDSSGSRVYLYLAALAAGLSVLSKIYGISAILFLVLYMIYQIVFKRQKQISRRSLIATALVSLLLSLTWFAYGFLVAPSLFVKLLTLNAQRSVLSGGSNIDLLSLVQSPLVTSSQISGGEWSLPVLIGLAGLVYLFLRADMRLFQLCIVAYLGFSLAIGYFWFYTTIPLYPFYSIGIGSLIYALIFRKKDSARSSQLIS
jgi:4-amino-4-deoxy-L-arabinose transferase-like glycosyltransferase